MLLLERIRRSRASVSEVIYMKIAEINSVYRGSTGKIACQIAEKAINGRQQVMLCVPKGRHNKTAPAEYIRLFGSRFSEDIHIILYRLTGFTGCFSRFSTKRLLKTFDRYKPDLIHLHNLHNCYINLKMLFGYIKKRNIPVIWTLHDCWAFTGRCPHFIMSKCDKWKTGCADCPYPKSAYPQTFFDRTDKMYRLKKEWFTGIEKLTLVTPSRWLADLVKSSFLKDYPVKVINNGIDLSVFKPTESDFRQRRQIGEKFMLLGVADSWGRRKGLDVFSTLAKTLDGSKYQIVLVGTDAESENLLPDNIICIPRTQNQQQLAEIYTAADLFVNPTREENYPTVNMESIACGTPVLTFKTGGSPECIDETCGAAVDCDDTEALIAEIICICEEKPYTPDACLKRAKAFDKDKLFGEYLNLYENRICI